MQTADIIRDTFLGGQDGLKVMDTDAREEYVLGVIMTQYSLNRIQGIVNICIQARDTKICRKSIST